MPTFAQQFSQFTRSVQARFARVDIRLRRLETAMADITQAEADLAAVVTETVSNEQGLADQVKALQASIAAGDPAATQAAADAIEAQVAALQSALPAPAAPADVPPPA